MSKCCPGRQYRQLGKFYFDWCCCVICQAMRSRKLEAQISAHCESSRLCDSGEETERDTGRSLAEDTAVLYSGKPSWYLDFRRSEPLGNGRQLQLLSTAGRRERAASSSCSGQQGGNETIDGEENVSLSGER